VGRRKFATRQDLEELKKWAEEKFVTKEYFDAVIKRIEDKMATKEQIESITISVEDSGREMVQYLLEQRGYKCAAERLRLDSDYEFDIYCNAGAVTAVGEAKVRAGGRDVEKTLERAQELSEEAAGDKISGRARAGALHPSRRALSQCKRQRSSRYGSLRAREKSWRWRRSLGGYRAELCLRLCALWRLGVSRRLLCLPPRLLFCSAGCPGGWLNLLGSSAVARLAAVYGGRSPRLR
jgi:hypothetical protein